MGGLNGGTPLPKLDFWSPALGMRMPKSGVPAEDAVVGGLMERRLGALPFARIRRSPPNRSGYAEIVGDGELISGVRAPKLR